MNPQNPKYFIFTLLILISIQIPPNSAQNPQYEACRRPFNCGGITNIAYPFYGGDRPPSCGANHTDFHVTCQDDDVALVTISSIQYQIRELNTATRSLRIARLDLFNNFCPTLDLNTTLNPNLFDLNPTPNYVNVTLFHGCGVFPTLMGNQFNCNSANGDVFSSGFYMTGGMSVMMPDVSCRGSVFVPVNETTAVLLAVPGLLSLEILRDAVVNGFWARWLGDWEECGACVGSGGACGTDLGTGGFVCYCGDGVHGGTCNGTGNGNGNGSNRGLQIGLPIAGAVFAGFGFAWLVFFCKQRRKKQQLLSAKSSSQALSNDVIITPVLSSRSPVSSTTPSTTFTKSIPSFPSSKSDFGRSTSYFGAQVFNYAELEEATDNFNATRELGDGGFGTVYYGLLLDGRKVAVKRLYENNFKRVEQFMNEVEILTRLRHENLVILYGCTSKRSRELLLVYEYVSNGTVADHLHGKRAKSGLLSWPIRLNIAIETAHALAYLHKSDIIHRDVKTTNILLDNDFHVKVADFGLSRLFPNDVTHVSTAPQGTPGYVDPEYYQCYRLTEKSDVYSFGVVLIELISSLQAVDTSRHRHDINLSNMAINRIQSHLLHELVDSSFGFETNSVVRRMATLVAELAFRCLQQERDMRPSMDEVLECLRGIKNEDLNAHKVEILDISDEVGLLKGGGFVCSSPDSSEKFTNGERSY